MPGIERIQAIQRSPGLALQRRPELLEPGEIEWLSGAVGWDPENQRRVVFALGNLDKAVEGYLA